MMCSSASTAAYLIYTSICDNAAELYLRNVFQYGQGRGLGGFPSAFPTSNFEMTWVLTLPMSTSNNSDWLTGTVYFTRGWILGQFFGNRKRAEGGQLPGNDPVRRGRYNWL